MIAANIATLLTAPLHGNPDLPVLGLCDARQPKPNYAVVIHTTRGFTEAIDGGCTVVVCPEAYLADRPQHDVAMITVTDTDWALVRLLSHFAPASTTDGGLHPRSIVDDSAHIDPTVSIGANAIVGANAHIGANSIIHPNSVIGANVHIGRHCTIFPQVTVYANSVIGDRVRVHAGAVIGCDGFGYYPNQGQHFKKEHLGCVVIEDDVEIGANTTIDRGTIGETRIGAGTKIDNQVQVAHNVTLGRHNLLCAFTGIAGSSSSGDHVTFAADVGVANGVTIGDRVTLGARTGIAPNKKLASDTMWLGNPGRPLQKAISAVAMQNRLPEMRQRLINLEVQLKVLSERLAKLMEATA